MLSQGSVLFFKCLLLDKISSQSLKTQHIFEAILLWHNGTQLSLWTEKNILSMGEKLVKETDFFFFSQYFQGCREEKKIKMLFPENS